MQSNKELIDSYFKEHKLFSETYKTACKEILERYQKAEDKVKIDSQDNVIESSKCAHKPMSPNKAYTNCEMCGKLLQMKP